MKYYVSIEKEGKLYRAGILEGKDYNDVGFTYDSAYLKDLSPGLLCQKFYSGSPCF